METEKQIAEMELPQLRQMVLENTRRIEKNELMISEMRMKRREEEQKQQERETYWDVARDEHDRAHREHERDMRELRKILHEHSVSFDAAMKRSDEKREKWHQEFDESLRKSREEDEERHRKFEEELKKSREEDEERHRKFDEDLKRSREEDEERHRKFDEDLKKSREEFDESLRKSQEEDEERHRKFDEDLKKSREEFDESLRKSQEEDEERHRKFDEDLKKSREDFDRRMKESDEYFKKQREEDDKKFKARMDELDKSVNRATEAVSNLARQVSSVTGNIVEGLLGPASRKMFIDAGYPISRCCKRVQIGDKGTRQTAMEIDVMEYGETMVIAVEVKADCEKKDIRKILKKMARFKELCPEHADKEVLAGVAAVNFEEGAYELAKESGLIIIHVKEESVFELEPEFTLDPVPDKCVLRRF